METASCSCCVVTLAMGRPAINAALTGRPFPPAGRPAGRAGRHNSRHHRRIGGYQRAPTRGPAMNRRQLMMLAGGLPLMSTAYAQDANAPQPSRRSVLAVGRPVAGAERPGRRPARPGEAAARRLPRGAGQCRVCRLLQRPEEPVADRRQRRPDPDQRLGRCLDVDAQRLCRGRAQCSRRRGRSQLRAHPSTAARREGRRSLLSGDVERTGLAAGVDARHEPHRAARRLCRPGLQRSPAAGGVAGRRRGVAAGLRRGLQGRPLRAGRRLHHGGRGRPDPERRLRHLLQALRPGGRRPDRGRGGDGRRHGAHRQCLHQRRTCSGP